MSDNPKLDPATLSAEERAIVQTCALNYWNNEYQPDEAWRLALDQQRPFILARRALFGTATEKAQESAFPVGNCKVCGELVAPYNKHAKYEGGYTCKPAQPEPAAQGKMPEAVYIAANTLRASGHVTLADALLKEAWHLQPVAVGMTEELSMVLLRAEYGATEDERNPNLRDGYVARLKDAIAAVRQQAAQVKPKVELPKVGIPVPVDALKRACATCSLDDCMTIAGWLDAVEGRK